MDLINPNQDDNLNTSEDINLPMASVNVEHLDQYPGNMPPVVISFNTTSTNQELASNCISTNGSDVNYSFGTSSSETAYTISISLNSPHFIEKVRLKIDADPGGVLDDLTINPEMELIEDKTGLLDASVTFNTTSISIYIPQRHLDEGSTVNVQVEMKGIVILDTIILYLYKLTF